MDKAKMKLLVLALILSLPQIAAAQSISIEDLQKQIDAEVSKVNPYQELLNDPDPKRAQAAMKIMLESKDPVLVDLALEFGLYSPEKNVRFQALVGYLNTLPKLDIFFDGSKAEPEAFQYDADNYYESGVSESGMAFWSPKIAAYSANKDCYGANNDGSFCVLQVRSEIIRLSINNRTWYELTLTDDGALIGVVDLNRAKRIPVRVQLR